MDHLLPSQPLEAEYASSRVRSAIPIPFYARPIDSANANRHVGTMQAALYLRFVLSASMPGGSELGKELHIRTLQLAQRALLRSCEGDQVISPGHGLLQLNLRNNGLTLVVDSREGQMLFALVLAVDTAPGELQLHLHETFQPLTPACDNFWEVIQYGLGLGEADAFETTVS